MFAIGRHRFILRLCIAITRNTYSVTKDTVRILIKRHCFDLLHLILYVFVTDTASDSLSEMEILISMFILTINVNKLVRTCDKIVFILRYLRTRLFAWSRVVSARSRVVRATYSARDDCGPRPRTWTPANVKADSPILINAFGCSPEYILPSLLYFL